MARYKIGEAADRLSSSRSTLIRLENKGLIPPADRTIAGRRVYTEADLRLLEELLYPRGKPNA